MLYRRVKFSLMTASNRMFSDKFGRIRRILLYFCRNLICGLLFNNSPFGRSTFLAEHISLAYIIIICLYCPPDRLSLLPESPVSPDVVIWRIGKNNFETSGVYYSSFSLVNADDLKKPKKYYNR